MPKSKPQTALESAADYYPFGMEMPGRGFVAGEYRFGFQGQEMDNEIAGVGNSYTAEYWQYDSRLMRRWTLDPEPKVWESPFAAFANNPIWFTDPNGRDSIVNPNGERWNVGDGYTASNDKTVLYGEGLQTKVWDQTALSSGGGDNGNYVNYDAEFSNSTFDITRYVTINQGRLLSNSGWKDYIIMY